MNKLKWTAARLLFHAYLAFSLLTIVGGFLTGPVMTWYFFGDWRFWRHFVPCSKLFVHGWKIAWLILRGHNGGFMLAVPLTSPPASAPDPEIVHRSPNWKHGASCGTCTNCCSLISCPVLDEKTGLCLGYNSFFWRYFNCGRYPTYEYEIDYYDCPKWLMNPLPSFLPGQAAAEGRPSFAPGQAAAAEGLPAGATDEA